MPVPRILSSSKYQSAIVVTLTTLALWFFSVTDKNLDRQHKLEASQGAIKVICAAWFVATGATALEDAAEKHGKGYPTPPAAPSTTVNTAENQTVNPAAPPGPAPMPIITAGAVRVVSNAPIPGWIPPKTTNPLPKPMTPKLPDKAVIPKLLILCLFAAGLTGCQAITTAQCTGYRESLHSLDEGLYTAHTLLMADAVKAGLRTATDQQVVTAGIAQAEALYKQSVATDAAGAVK